MGHNGIIAASRRMYATTDTTPPSAPSSVYATNLCVTTLRLNWSGATDNVGVTGYEIYKSGVLYLDVGNVSFYDITGETAGSSVSWRVKSYDAAGNRSALSSASASVTMGVLVWGIVVNTIPAANKTQACGATKDKTRYITGGNSTPTNGEYMYEDSCGTTIHNGGGDWQSDGTWAFTVATNGLIGGVTAC